MSTQTEMLLDAPAEAPDGGRCAVADGSGRITFKRLFAGVLRRQRERIRKAGEHKCVKTAAGSMSRVTGRGGKILKRPVVAMRFYECKICGRDMTPNGAVRRGGENNQPKA